jgi:hypothetical protein
VPEPSTSPVAALLDKYTCCAVPNDQPFGLRTSSRSFVIRKHKAETGGCVEAICTIHTELSPLACAIKHLLGPCLAWCQTPHACTHSSCLCATLVTAVLHRRPYHRPRTRVLHTLGHSPPPRPAARAPARRRPWHAPWKRHVTRRHAADRRGVTTHVLSRLCSHGFHARVQ